MSAQPREPGCDDNMGEESPWAAEARILREQLEAEKLAQEAKARAERLLTYPQSIDLAALLELDIPQPKQIAGNLVREGAQGIIAAARGVGKTFFSLGMGVSIACGKPFLEYDVTEPGEVLFIDGEMSIYDIKERLRLLALPMQADRAALQRMHIITPDFGDKLMPAINKPEAGQFLMDYLDSRPKINLVFFDNFACLTRLEAGDTFGALAWGGVNDLMKMLRRRRVASFAVAHHGKSDTAGVRGASQAEDLVDISIALTPGEESSEATKVNVMFKKGRHLKPDEKEPFVAALTGSADSNGFGNGYRWTRQGKVSLTERIRHCFGLGMSPSDIHADVGGNRQRVYEVREQMVSEGLLEPLAGKKDKPAQKRYQRKPFRRDE